MKNVQKKKGIGGNTKRDNNIEDTSIRNNYILTIKH